jgi:hypothetical protein
MTMGRSRSGSRSILLRDLTLSAEAPMAFCVRLLEWASPDFKDKSIGVTP